MNETGSSLKSPTQLSRSTQDFVMPVIRAGNMEISVTPGPGTYNPISVTFNPNGGHFIQERRPAKDLSETSGLDFHYVPSFRPTRTTTIGQRGQLKFYESPDTPGPALPQETILPPIEIKIGQRREGKICDENIPGPGQYVPQEVTKTIPLKLESRPKRPNLWGKLPENPGPGAYDVGVPVEPPKRWASRLRNCKPMPVMQLKRTLNRNSSSQAAFQKKIIL